MSDQGASHMGVANQRRSMIMRAKEAPAPPPKTWVPRNANWCQQPLGPQSVRQRFELAINRTPAQGLGPTFPSSILI